MGMGCSTTWALLFRRAMIMMRMMTMMMRRRTKRRIAGKRVFEFNSRKNN